MSLLNTPQIKKNIGKRLSESREALKLEIKEYAALLGVHPNTIYQYEKGINSISNEMLYKLMQTFKLNVSWLIDGIGEMYILDAYEEKEPKKEVDPETKKIYEICMELDLEDKIKLLYLAEQLHLKSRYEKNYKITL